MGPFFKKKIHPMIALSYQKLIVFNDRGTDIYQHKCIKKCVTIFVQEKLPFLLMKFCPKQKSKQYKSHSLRKNLLYQNCLEYVLLEPVKLWKTFHFFKSNFITKGKKIEPGFLKYSTYIGFFFPICLQAVPIHYPKAVV